MAAGRWRLVPIKLAGKKGNATAAAVAFPAFLGASEAWKDLLKSAAGP